MIPWIQVYTNVGCHPKTARLAELLEIRCGTVQPAVVAVGILVSIWSWAAQNAVDGDLSGVSPSVIADACRWKKSPQKLRDALVEAGYLDGDGKLHDWDEYHVLLMDAEERRREKTKERVRRFRKKNVGEGCPSSGSAEPNHLPQIGDPGATQVALGRGGAMERADVAAERQRSRATSATTWGRQGRCNADVTVTSVTGNAPTVPDLTGQDHIDDDNDDPRGREVDDSVRKAIKRHWGRDADERDLVRGRREMVYFDADAGRLCAYDAALVDYCFDVSERAGVQAQNWRFVEGVMRKLRQRGITDVEGAVEYDEERG